MIVEFDLQTGHRFVRAKVDLGHFLFNGEVVDVRLVAIEKSQAVGALK